MRYRELAIQTQREAPNNARTTGAAMLVRAAYLTREGDLLPLGQRAVERIQSLGLEGLSLPLLSSTEETFFPVSSGTIELLHCPSCGMTARAELAEFRKFGMPPEEPLPMEKVATPDCPTIESLAAFLKIPKEKTAKALMYTRLSDGRFVFVVVRGDMTLSEAKLRRHVGEVRLATAQEIQDAGAVPGYASPVGLKEGLIAVDDLVTVSSNLAAGANEAGYHLIHTNCGRDYTAGLVADLALAGPGSPCSICNTPLEVLNADLLAEHGKLDGRAALLALAEANHDDKGLSLPAGAAPFDVYLMHVPGKEMDTRLEAEKVYEELEASGIAVLFDDREERAGVKFNDADLIGCPLRVTVGERALKEGKVEVKERTGSQGRLVERKGLAGSLKDPL